MTGKAARDKGIRWERAVAKWLGTRTTRSARPGVHDDGGDIVLPGHVVECKDVGRWDLPGWWRHLEAKCEHDIPVLVVKQRGRPTGDALVVMRLADWWPTEERP